MDIGKLLATKFSDKDTVDQSEKNESAQRTRTSKEWRDRNFAAVESLFGPIIESFNEGVGNGPRLKMESRTYELRFDHGFSRVMLLLIGEAHLELTRGGAQGRKTQPFSKPFFFISYDADGNPIFSESYHIESSWISGEEFALLSLREALGIE